MVDTESHSFNGSSRLAWNFFVPQSNIATALAPNEYSGNTRNDPSGTFLVAPTLHRGIWLFAFAPPLSHPHRISTLTVDKLHTILRDFLNSRLLIAPAFPRLRFAFGTLHLHVQFLFLFRSVY